MKTAFFVFVLCAFILTACAQTAAPTQAPAGRDLAPASPGESATGSEAYNNKAGQSNILAQQPAAVNRLVIKNADMIIVVADPSAGMSAILQMANEMGGYVVSSKSFKTRSENGIEVPQANITVRIPSDKLDDALAKIKKLTQDPVKDVRSENITGKDVTAEYVDLSSRLTNLQNTEKQLQKIQDSATKTDDVLAVFNRLVEVRQQVEQIKGQAKYYEESAALSAISIQLLSKEGVAPLTVGGWEPAGIVRDAFQTLIDIGKSLVEILIWLVIVFLPLGLIFYFPVRWLIRLIRKNMANRPAPMAAMPYYTPSTGGFPPSTPGFPPSTPQVPGASGGFPIPPMDQPPQSGPVEPPSQSA